MVKKIKIDKDILSMVNSIQDKIHANTNEVERLAFQNKEHAKKMWDIIYAKYPAVKSNETAIINYKSGILIMCDSQDDTLLMQIRDLKRLAIEKSKYEIAGDLRNIERKLFNNK